MMSGLKELEPIPPGEPGDPPDVPPEASSRRGRRRLLVTVAVAVAATSGFAVLTRDEPDDAADRLATIRRFVASAGSVRFEATHQVGDGTRGLTYRTRGVLRFPGWARRLSHGGQSHDEESIRSPLGSYTRSAAPGEVLADLPWTFTPPEASFRDGATGFDGRPDFGGLLTGLGPPLDAEPDRADLRAVVGSLRRPERVDGRTLRATLPLRALFTERRYAEAMADGTGSVRVLLTSGPGGRLDRMVWKLDARRLDAETGARCDIPFPYLPYGHPVCVNEQAEISFSAWDKPVKAAVPDIGDVDTTPGIEEEHLAGAPAGLALAPARVPAGLLLRWADFNGGGSGAEDGCPVVTLGYGPAAGSRAGPNLSLNLFGEGCPESDRVAGTETPGRTLAAGPFRVTVDQEPVATFGIARFRAGPAAVHLEWNDLAEVDLIDALASLAPLDLDTQPVYQSIPPGA